MTVSMKSFYLQRGLLGLSVLILMIGRMMMPAGLVICEDRDGGGRIEAGCSKTADGSCVAICGDAEVNESESHVPHPCQDTPIEDDPAITKAPQRLTELPAVAVAMWPAFAIEPETDDRRIPASRRWAHDPRPPDEVLRLRTVVLLV
jgi:hypothetical protein